MRCAICRALLDENKRLKKELEAEKQSAAEYRHTMEKRVTSENMSLIEGLPWSPVRCVFVCVCVCACVHVCVCDGISSLTAIHCGAVQHTNPPRLSFAMPWTRSRIWNAPSFRPSKRWGVRRRR